MPLRKVRLLDARKAEVSASEPWCDSVAIPYAELLPRIYELPPRSEIVQISADDDLTAEWLEARGYGIERVTPTPGPRENGRLWNPSAWLEELLPDLEPGTALDLGCGSGRDVVFLSAAGWSTAGWDRLPDALERARDLAARHGVTAEFAQIDIRNAPIPDVPYDLITMFAYLNRSLLGSLRDWIRPGGSFVAETFSAEHRETFGKPSSEELILEPEFAEAALSDFDIRHCESGRHGERLTTRIWAVRK